MGAIVGWHEALAWPFLTPTPPRRAFPPRMLRLRTGLFKLDLDTFSFVPAVEEQKSVLEAFVSQVC